MARLHTLQEMRQAECYRLDASHEAVDESIRRLIDRFDKLIEQVEAKISEALDAHPELEREERQMQEILGLRDR